MVNGRLSRDDFYAVLGQLDEADLKKALWTLYWRGSADFRDRIMAAIDPAVAAAQASKKATPVDAVRLESEVKEFAALAREGAYLGRDRRVSPKERTRWRFIFRSHATAATQALSGHDVIPAASAMATLIDLAGEMRSRDYFRSEDPIEAARFVVSEAAAVMWSAIRREQGHDAFCEHAAPQFLRWESCWGWTRRGEGWVAEQETSLTQVIAGMLPIPDAWGQFAEAYLRALDAEAGQARPSSRRTEGMSLRARRENLAEWHAMLQDKLADGEYHDTLDQIVNHPALKSRK